MVLSSTEQLTLMMAELIIIGEMVEFGERVLVKVVLLLSLQLSMGAGGVGQSLVISLSPHPTTSTSSEHSSSSATRNEVGMSDEDKLSLAFFVGERSKSLFVVESQLLSSSSMLEMMQGVGGM